MDHSEAGPADEAAPLISCLMVSRGNFFPAHLAVQCYRNQTYSNRELVIVCAQPNSALSHFVATLNDPTIRYIESPPKALGDLRNVSVDAARGSLLCIWDDDDLYHARRLEVQASAHLASGSAAHFLSRLLLWWPERRLLAITCERSWENSMLVRRDALPRYPSLQIREDTDVVDNLRARHQTAMSNEPELYCYVVHSQNTSDVAHFEHLFHHADWLFPDYDGQLARLSASFPLRWYADELIASGSQMGDGVSATDPNGPLVLLSDRSFGNEEVRTDGIHFRRCTFTNSQLIYLGGRIPILEDCDLGQSEIVFDGSAGNTVNWLRQLKQAGLMGDL
jgi:glycosyltransferase involved in cell wall biosynthesis